MSKATLRLSRTVANRHRGVYWRRRGDPDCHRWLWSSRTMIQALSHQREVAEAALGFGDSWTRRTDAYPPGSGPLIPVLVGSQHVDRAVLPQDLEAKPACGVRAV